MQFPYNTLLLSTLMKNKCMSYFDIYPLHGDALLVSFNEICYPFRREAFWLLRIQHLQPLAGLGTQRAQTLRYPKSSCTLVMLIRN